MVSIKKKLQEGELTVGTWQTIGNSTVTEILCQSGFEWITVDMEHSPITLSEAQEIIRTIDLYGAVPAVRVGENDPTIIKRVMDAGAKIIIVPMVNTPEDAYKAVSAVKYPPEGTRGVGLARAQEYGFGFEKYKKWNHEESVVVVQIEHIDAIHNLEAILSVPGVDASFIGPYDLSGSLGYPGDFERPEFIEALKKYERISNDLKKPMGFHVVQPDMEKVKEYIGKGYLFMAIGLDTLFLGTKCREVIGDISKI